MLKNKEILEIKNIVKNLNLIEHTDNNRKIILKMITSNSMNDIPLDKDILLDLGNKKIDLFVDRGTSLNTIMKNVENFIQNDKSLLSVISFFEVHPDYDVSLLYLSIDSVIDKYFDEKLTNSVFSTHIDKNINFGDINISIIFAYSYN